MIANGTISQGAQEKIWHKFRTQKIKFVALDDLTRLTAKYIPDFGVDVDLYDAEYLHQQREFCLARDEKYSLMPDGFDETIEQDIIKLEKDFSSRRQVVDIYSEIESRRLVSIEAQMGGGKSRLLSRVVQHYATLDVYKEKKILPIFESGKDFLRGPSSLSDLISKAVETARLREDEERRYLIVLDGLDEARLSSGEVVERLSKCLQELSELDNCKLLIASREVPEELTNLSREFQNGRYEIEPLRLKGMVQFIERICNLADKSTTLISDLKNSDLFKVLPRTPIAAIILARLFAEGGEELPMNLTELYAKYMELSLGRWDMDKGLQTQKQYDVLEVLVSNLAVYMMENELLNLSEDEAKQMFREYLRERNLELDSEQLFESLVSRSDVIVKDDFTRTISFKHRSFAEYFCARHHLRSRSAVVDGRVFSPYWANTYFFHIGMLRDCEALLTEIMKIPIEHEAMRMARLMHMGNFLLAAYQTPYSVVERAIRELFSDAAHYYYDIAERREESVFAILPRMHVLAFFAHMMRSNYGFSFFSTAVISALEDISLSKDRDGESMYAIFFLDSIRFYLKEDALYEDLIDQYGGELPLDLQLAIGYESKRVDYNSPVIKKLQRRVKKHARTSRSFRAQIDTLHEKSIDGSIDHDAMSQYRKRKK